MIAAVRGANGKLSSATTSGRGPVLIQNQRWATADEVAAGFAAASSDLQIPPSHAVYRQSWMNMVMADYRLAVIDACSAAEMAIAAAVAESLRARGLSEAETEQLLRLGSGIAQGFQVYRQIVKNGHSAVSQNRVIERLARPRNRAVHAGERPDEVTARHAIDTAAMLIREAVPLPSPEAILRLTRAKSHSGRR
jgi:hypothetical protein